MTHAVCMALLDAAIPLRTTFSSLTCAFTDDGDMITDPDFEQENKEDTRCVLTYIIDREGKLVTSHTTGTFTSEQVNVFDNTFN